MPTDPGVSFLAAIGTFLDDRPQTRHPLPSKNEGGRQKRYPCGKKTVYNVRIFPYTVFFGAYTIFLWKFNETVFFEAIKIQRDFSWDRASGRPTPSRRLDGSQETIWTVKMDQRKI